MKAGCRKEAHDFVCWAVSLCAIMVSLLNNILPVGYATLRTSFQANMALDLTEALSSVPEVIPFTVSNYIQVAVNRIRRDVFHFTCNAMLLNTADTDLLCKNEGNRNEEAK